MKMNNRMKNYGLWVALFALLGMILSDTLGLKFLPDRYNQYVDVILVILVYLGIINNPTTENKWFSDDK